MFNLIYTGNTLPGSFVVDPSCEFEPGTIGQFTVSSNQVMITVSDGTAPIGIIDDIKTKSFTNNSWNEIVEVPATGTPVSGGYVTTVDVTTNLTYAAIVGGSFLSTVACVLNSVNGTVTFPAGTFLNVDLNGGGIPSGIRAIVNYRYFVANIPGDDSTLGSGRVTLWYQRLFFDTSIFETNQQYPINAPLFVNETGMLTTRKSAANVPCVAIVVAPPSPMSPKLQAMWI